MDFAGLVARFGQSYAVTRREGATVGADGIVDLATPTTVNIVAYVQPAGGAIVQRLPEGTRDVEQRVLYTATRLKVFADPDVVTIDGDDWEVSDVEDWSTVGNYFKVTVSRVLF